MGETVSFKVYLTVLGDKDQAEVRKFVVDKEVSTSFTYLQEKLATVFPCLQTEIFTITWTDEDGDMVTIATDEELNIALTQMKGPVYKIHIHVKEDNKIEDSNKSNMDDEVTGVLPNVTCDGCEKLIEGFRYKCLVCDDYDLCGDCDAAGVHPDHNMVKIANSKGNFPQHFFKRLHRMQEKIERRRLCREGIKENLVGEHDVEEVNVIHEAKVGGAGRGRRGRGMLRGTRMLRGRGVQGGHHGCKDKAEKEAEDTEVENDNQIHGKRLGKAGHGRRGCGTFGRRGKHCCGLRCRQKRQENQAGDIDGEKLEGNKWGRRGRGIFGARAGLRMERNNSLLSGGPCLGPRAAMRMARHNPLIYQALLQATLSNSLAPPKMLPRRRLLNLRKRRILAGQLRGRNNMKCCSPRRNSSTNNIPQPQPIHPTGSQGNQ